MAKIQFKIAQPIVFVPDTIKSLDKTLGYIGLIYFDIKSEKKLLKFVTLTTALFLVSLVHIKIRSLEQLPVGESLRGVPFELIS